MNLEVKEIKQFILSGEKSGIWLPDINIAVTV